MTFNGMNEHEAAEFAARWLPAWSGNRPELLVAFYAKDAFYADPGVPEGLRGRRALLEYFRRLLARYPDWVWTQERALPLHEGFLNFWKAEIPERDRRVVLRGVCTVQLCDGLITRNEVFFDRLPWLARPK
jgi:hypothetical protein